MDRHRYRALRPEKTPLFTTSVYTFPSLGAVEDYYGGNEAGQYLYRRNGHPNGAVLEAALANLERTEAAFLCSSGMAAIAQACFAHLRPGDHVIATSWLYGGTYAFFEEILRPFGIAVDYAPLDNEAELERLWTPATRLIYTESIANPLLQVADIPHLAKFAASRTAMLFVDNTFATPQLVRPCVLGATLSIHSLTKFLNGHSDVIAGAVTGNHDVVEKVRRFGVTFGGTLAPFDAWMTERGLETFGVRYPVQCKNAVEVSRFLESHPLVKRVYYPGLPSHPSHSLAKQVLTGGFGAMLSFELEGGYREADELVRKLAMIEFAPSLGGTRTTLSHPASTSHRAYTPEQREQLGVTDGLLRMSVGVEPSEELLADLEQGFSALSNDV